MLKVINSEIILFRFALISVSMACCFGSRIERLWIKRCGNKCCTKQPQKINQQYKKMSHRGSKRELQKPRPDRLTLGQTAIWTLTRAKSLCLCAFFSSPGKRSQWHIPRGTEKHTKIRTDESRSGSPSFELGCTPVGGAHGNTAF